MVISSVARGGASRNSFVQATAPAGYQNGEALYRAGKPLGHCLSDEESAGWNDAADRDLRGALAYLKAMEAEGMPARMLGEVSL